MTTTIPASDLFDLERSILFTRKEEHVSVNLQSLAERALANIAPYASGRWNSPSDEAPQAIAAQLNIGALMQFQCGRLPQAEELCTQSIELFAGMADTTGDHSWLFFAVQPWINVGRLAALKGNAAEARRIFKEVYEYFHGDGDIALGPVHISNKHRPTIARTLDGNIATVCTNVYVRDSIKACLISRDFEGLLAFVDDLVCDTHVMGTPGLQLSVTEGRVRALIGLHRFNEALGLLDEFHRSLSNSTFQNVGLCMLIPHIYATRSRRDLAERSLAAMEKYQQRLSSFPSCSSAVKKLLYHLGLARYDLRDYVAAAVHAGLAYKMCLEGGDEAGAIKALVLSVRIATDAGAESAAGADLELAVRALAEAAAGTWYSWERAIARCELARAAVLSSLSGVDATGASKAYAVQAMADLQGFPTPDSFRLRDLLCVLCDALPERGIAIDNSPPEVERVYEGLMSLRSFTPVFT